MCGRFISGADEITWREYCELLGLPTTAPQPPEGDRNPTQLVTTIRAAADGTHREAIDMLWGLLPRWAKHRKEARKLFNVRSETVATKFGGAFRSGRCVLPARGFFEWQQPPPGAKQKVQHVIHDVEHPLMSLAGIWSRWEDEEGVIETCSILTTEAAEALRAVHHRMPVILDSKGANLWLDPDAPADGLQGLLLPRDAASIVVEPLDRSKRFRAQGDLFD